MAKQCFVPSAAGVRFGLASRFGHIVEWFVKQEYCAAKGGCNQFVLNGSGTDFFDEDSTTTRCRFLANYLATHNLLLSESDIANACEIRKSPVDDDDDENERFAVPDIVTHEPGVRMEFYEIKANSTSGKSAGRVKIQTFSSLVDFLRQTDPGARYEKGTQFDPDRSILIWDGTWFGSPSKVFLHIKREDEALIVYEICVEVSGGLLAEMLVKMLIKMAVIALIMLLLQAGAGGVVLAWTSPLSDSVGPDGTNDSQDVRYVQVLLNDWLVHTGGSSLAIDGTLTSETTGALVQFQTALDLDDTGGNVLLGEQTIATLEHIHLQNSQSSLVSTEMDELGTDGLADAVFKDDPDGVDPEVNDEPDVVVALGIEYASYLQDLYDAA